MIPTPTKTQMLTTRKMPTASWSHREAARLMMHMGGLLSCGRIPLIDRVDGAVGLHLLNSGVDVLAVGGVVVQAEGHGQVGGEHGAVQKAELLRVAVNHLLQHGLVAA